MQKKLNFNRIAHCVGLSSSDTELINLMDLLATYENSIRTKYDNPIIEFLEFKTIGIAFRFEDKILKSVFFMSKKMDSSYTEYSGDFPIGLDWSYSFSDVIASVKLEPRGQGGGIQGSFGYINPWVRYNLGSYNIHIEFTADYNKIQMITVSPLP